MTIALIQRSLKRKWRRLKRDLLLPIIVILGVLFAPLWIVLGCFLESQDKSRKLAAANRAHCQMCGNILGTASVSLADTEQQQRLAEAQEAYPGHRIQLAPRTTYAICTKCGQRYTFVEKLNRFLPETDDQLGQ